MNRIMCPYCKIDFPEDYYDRWHVPCPEREADELAVEDDPIQDQAPAGYDESDFANDR